MRAHIARAVLLAVFLPAAAVAQTVSLTEAEALARLLPEGPRMLAARAGVDAARADVLRAARWPNPRVTINREAVAGVAENMFTVSQVLPVTGRRRLEMGAASAHVSAMLSRADDRVRRLRADLRLAFAALVAAQSREQELARSRARLRELVEILARREAAGEGAGFDRLRADREVLEIDASLADAAVSRARAQAVLTSFFSADAVAVAVTALPSDRQAPLPPLDTLQERAQNVRGELHAWTHEQTAAALALEAAGRRLVPEPEVVAGTKSSNAGTGDAGSILSVHVSLPIFDRGGPEKAAAQARALQARAEAEAFRRVLRADVAAWRATVAERRAIAERYRAAVADGTDQIERIAEVSYDAGERGILELLDAHRTAAAARVRLTELQAAAREAEIELEFVSGWEMP